MPRRPEPHPLRPLVPVLTLATRLHHAARARTGARALLRAAAAAGDPALAAEIARLSGVRARLRGARTVDDKLRLNSNIVAATDLTLMALAGIGLRCNKDGLWSYGITCIEYTEFEKYGIPEPTVITGSSQVSYPANTNILYVDLQAVEEIGSRKNASCLPGMVLNLKKAVSYVDHFGFDGRV